MTAEPWNPTDAEHIAQCEQAGCEHPAVYYVKDHPEKPPIQGWCKKCRAEANASLSPEARELADEASEEWFDSLDDYLSGRE